MSYEILHGDALDALSLCIEDNSIDAIVCDPPYGLSFMGRHWDYDVPSIDIWRECLRVLKPGGHLLAFAGTRTQHRMAVNIEDAGFEIRDMIAWIYGSGFPKSLDVSKAIDKAAGADRVVLEERPAFGIGGGGCLNGHAEGATYKVDAGPATAAAAAWQGWGTALKPALEPITVARKPLGNKTVAENVLQFGTGGLNIDGCRVEGWKPQVTQGINSNASSFNVAKERRISGDSNEGRWPANLIHDGSDEVLAGFPDSNGSGGSVPNVKISGYGDGVVGSGKSEYFGGPRTKVDAGSGSAARFFYCAKASKKDRDEGCEAFNAGRHHAVRPPHDGGRETEPRKNTHPTVKPTDLMRYLCRLVTPPGGLILDPFTGSGSTGKAAMLEGFRFIGIEREAEYVAIARARIERAKA